MSGSLCVVGIGEDGWNGLSASARLAIERAETIVGGERHLALLPPTDAERIPWPSPMLPFVDEVLALAERRAVVVLASGDPMLHGVGATLARRIAPNKLTVLPHLSAFSLACARLGWPSADITLLSTVGHPIERIAAHLHPGRRLVIYVNDGAAPAAIAELLREHGYGASALRVLEHLGGEREHRREGDAARWSAERCADLCVVALECVADEDARPLAAIPGLPDDAFETDGQITKREVRAATLARLQPLPGQLLWDVGAGSGSIGIEWMRAHPACRAIAFESREDRAHRIARNARHLGVPELRVVTGNAPETFARHASPDAIFIGGGISVPGMLDACRQALRPGGRLVANVVTVEGEALIARLHARWGGELTRIAVSRAGTIGNALTWRPLTPVTQWSAVKGETW